MFVLCAFFDEKLNIKYKKFSIFFFFFFLIICDKNFKPHLLFIGFVCRCRLKAQFESWGLSTTNVNWHMLPERRKTGRLKERKPSVTQPVHKKPSCSLIMHALLPISCINFLNFFHSTCVFRLSQLSKIFSGILHIQQHC